MAEVHVYEAATGRWAYRVGAVVQEWHPDKAGDVAMTKAEAEFLASSVAGRIDGEAPVGPAVEPGLTKLAFMGRFTDSELVTIYTAARQNPALEVWLDRLKLTTGNILLDDPRTVAGVHALEQAGLLSVGRAAEILA